LSVLPESESASNNNVNIVGKQKTGVKHSLGKKAESNAEIQSAVRDTLKTLSERHNNRNRYNGLYRKGTRFVTAFGESRG
jgi:hypothetical protein